MLQSKRAHQVQLNTVQISCHSQRQLKANRQQIENKMIQRLLLVCIVLTIIGFIICKLTVKEEEEEETPTKQSSIKQLEALLTNTCNGQQDDESTIENIKDNINSLFSTNKHAHMFKILNEKFCTNKCNGFSDPTKQSLATLLDEKLNEIYGNETDNNWMTIKYSDSTTLNIKDMYQCIDECGQDHKQCCNTNSVLFDEQCGCIDGFKGTCYEDEKICSTPPQDEIRIRCEPKLVGSNTVDPCTKCVQTGSPYPNKKLCAYECYGGCSTNKNGEMNRNYGMCYGTEGGVSFRCTVSIENNRCDYTPVTPAPTRGSKGFEDVCLEGECAFPYDCRQCKRWGGYHVCVGDVYYNRYCK